MSSKTLSSSVKIRTSEVPAEALRRYGFFEDHPELDFSRASDDRKLDQHLKDGITNALYRLELDSVKPSFDVLAKTGFRKSHHSRRYSPGEEVVFLSSGAIPHTGGRARKPARPYSYIEPRTLRAGSHFEDITTRKASPDRPIEVKETVVQRRPTSTAWYYTDPLSSYSSLQSNPSYYSPTHLRPVWEPEGDRVLSEYKDTVPRASNHRGRWSVYGSAPDWTSTRAQSTPPGRNSLLQQERRAASRVRGHPIVGNQLTRGLNREYSIGVKVAESQTDLDTFSRLLDKKFGAGGDNNSLPWRSTYGVYPLHPATHHYEYSAPRVQYDYIYSPRTRVTRPTERSVSYGYSDYVPYTGTSYYSTYSPASYSYSGYSSEPWYLPYSRSAYYSPGSYSSPLYGRYTTRYLY